MSRLMGQLPRRHNVPGADRLLVVLSDIEMGGGGVNDEKTGIAKQLVIPVNGPLFRIGAHGTAAEDMRRGGHIDSAFHQGVIGNPAGDFSIGARGLVRFGDIGRGRLAAGGRRLQALFEAAEKAASPVERHLVVVALHDQQDH